MRLSLLLPALVLTLVPYAHSEDFTIESLSGGETVTVTAPGHAAQELKAGSKLEVGARIKLQPGAVATLVSADGSRLVLSNAAEFEPGKSLDGVQGHTLHSGKIRGSVQSAAAQPGAGETKKKVRFLIRTKPAVMGVRGTVFEMALQGPDATRVETIEGVVEVARDESTLLSSGGTPVNAGQFVVADPSGISQPEPVAAAAAAAEAPASVVPAAAPSVPSPPVPVGTLTLLQDLTPTFHPFAFEVGVLASGQAELPAAGAGLSSANIQAKAWPFAAWKPGIGLPKLDFIRLRGHLAFGNQKGTWVRETGLFATLHVFDFVFGEVGIGNQAWLGQGVDGRAGSTFTINAGFLWSGFFDRIYFGRTAFDSNGAEIAQWRFGLGLGF